MAKIRVFQTIDNAVYEMRFETDADSLSELDKQLMEKWGEPLINLGGTFLADTANEYTLPDRFVRLYTGFPFVTKFDSKTTPFDTNTVTKVTGYRDAMFTRIDDAYTTLRAETDSFTGEQLHSI